MNWNDLDKAQRIQLKTLIIVLGLLLMILLLFLKLLMNGQHQTNADRQNPENSASIPVIETLKNVWIMDADAKGILIFCEGAEEYLFTKEKVRIVGGDSTIQQLADITLSDGEVEEILLKTEKINAKVLSAGADYVELEGYGKIPLAKDYKGYRLYQSISMCSERELSFGYAFADFVVENNEICGMLLAREEAMEQIRVLIKTSDYKGIYHDTIILSADCDYNLQYGTASCLKTQFISGGSKLTITKDSEFFEGDRIVITPVLLTGKLTLQNVLRSQGSPGYRGQMELIKTEEGIVVINQVSLEEYLYCVVPSEMPSSYPDEALKAQAVCARTYAYGKMLSAGYPQYGSHVDDSTSYQVYNNITEKESCVSAVKETYGQLLYTPDGRLAETYYYSTSCGVGSDIGVWRREPGDTLAYLVAKPINQSCMQGAVEPLNLQEEERFQKFIVGKDAGDFEVSEGWYRWTYHVTKPDTDKIREALKTRYDVNPRLILTLTDGSYVSTEIKSFSKIHNIYVEKRGNSGYAEELVIETDIATYKVISEYNIRYVLNNGVSKVVRQDGSEIASPTLLPSAFFVLSLSKEKENVVGYSLKGGGYGHGVGMSQNAAKAMAYNGYSYVDILKFFYEGCQIQCL